ncbi:MAG: hypothetical protein QMD97_01640 [Candidatus Aenigmarchaeota archaeon]|nr:hypothetical protein [Candidatus Aenigmarchaeota archaeon]
MIDPILVAGVMYTVRVGGWLYSIYDSTKTVSIKLKTEEGEFEPIIDRPRKKNMV